MGLGLYLAKLVVDFHLGKINIFNKKLGVCVTVKLPASLH
jgi:signal transduction histidine kinase